MFLMILLMTSLLSSWVLAFILCRGPNRFLALDHPNERSLHTTPVSRLGGVAILTGILSGTLLGFQLNYFSKMPFILLLAASPIVAVSLLDDFRDLSIKLRLIGHATGAAILIFAVDNHSVVDLLFFQLPANTIAAQALVFLFIVWMVNLYNFMDGIDGLAGGMAVIGFGSIAFIGWYAGAEEFALFNAVLAIAAGGFLAFNFPPARIFMGDGGASTLGFLAAGSLIWAQRQDIFPLWLGVLIFSPFIVDASVTLLRRAISGDAFWRAHRSH
ncbi:MAG: glycosyltransferase family 4 protein, partial [Gammaproteobacteria bacterium]|nr:glycosyltransferase family 4 protein [Gammaproteobacteria bacterium]